MATTKLSTDVIDLSGNTEALTIPSGTTGPDTTDTTGTCNYPTTATALYQLNSGVGSNVPDTCTPAYNGTATSITYSAGNFGNAANFNGTSSRITSSPISGLSSTSISCWLKSSNSSSSERRGVVELNADTSSNGYAGTLSILYRYSDGSILVRNGNASSSETDLLTHTDTTLRNGNWNNLVVTRNESTGVTTLYINGSQVDQETVASTSTVGGGTIIGDRYTGSAGNYNWDGQINQLRIFPSALTAAQASSLATETNVTSTGARPTSPTEGLMRENTTTGKMEFYDGSLWQEITDTASSYSPGLIPSANFNTALYTGTNATQSISSLNFKPDFIWFKNAKGTNWHALVNSVTGDRSYLFSNSTALKNDGSTSTAGNDLASFDTNGFTVGPGQVASSTNDTGGGANNTVAWSWKGGGAAVQNNDGTITGSNCMVSANVDAGFSIIKFTGTGSSFSNQTVGTGLDSAVEIYFIKGISNSGDSWIAGGSVLAVGGNNLTSFLRLNTSDAIGNTTSGSVGTSGNTINVGVRNYSSADSIVYGWHSVPGYSKIGFYVGGQPLNNPTQMYFGFTPAWIVIKNTTSSSSQWMVLDNKRTNGYAIYANSSNAESNYSADILLSSNGLEFKSNNINVNKLADIYIYMAFAE